MWITIWHTYQNTNKVNLNLYFQLYCNLCIMIITIHYHTSTFDPAACHSRSIKEPYKWPAVDMVRYLEWSPQGSFLGSVLFLILIWVLLSGFLNLHMALRYSAKLLTRPAEILFRKIWRNCTTGLKTGKWTSTLINVRSRTLVVTTQNISKIVPRGTEVISWPWPWPWMTLKVISLWTSHWPLTSH